MRFTTVQVVFQEVPDEISLAFSISGCSLRCKGCHSPELWSFLSGTILDINILKSYISKYDGMISCVLFYGGEWHEELPEYLQICRERKLKTCLYTGLDDVPNKIKEKLNYLKTGRWTTELGGLPRPTTNQRFFNLDTNQDITYRFQGR